LLAIAVEFVDPFRSFQQIRKATSVLPVPATMMRPSVKLRCSQISSSVQPAA
jgi:hypothetical protein